MIASTSQNRDKARMESSQKAKQPTQLYSTPLSQQTNQKDECKQSLLESAVKNIFGPCVGAVDVASYLIQSTCRGDEEKKTTNADAPVLGVKLKKPAPNSKVQRRQGETLEFPANGGFDDDVSAISAHTLEEMERLELLNKKRKAARAARNLQQQQDLGWTYQVNRPVSGSSNSLGVSTSGSASSGEDDKRLRPRGGETSRLVDI